MDDEDDMTLENRKLIYRHISNNPGSHLREISRKLKIHLSTLRYHINYLEKEGLIDSKKEENLKIYFISGKLPAKDKKITPLLQQKRFRNIILVIIVSPGLTHSEISNKLSIKPPTLTKYIHILEDRGIIFHEKVGREKRHYIIDEKVIMELLFTYKESFWDKFVDNILEIYFE